jgi:hypothetical protein
MHEIRYARLIDSKQHGDIPLAEALEPLPDCAAESAFDLIDRVGFCHAARSHPGIAERHHQSASRSDCARYGDAFDALGVWQWLPSALLRQPLHMLEQAANARRIAQRAGSSRQGYGTPVLLTNASRLPSGEYDGTLIVPWPPYTYAITRDGPPLIGIRRSMTRL